MDAVRADAAKRTPAESDTNYIFLSFVTHYLAGGLVGLIIGVIFTAAMSAISGEINSLATVRVIDIYRRHFPGRRSDRHYPARLARRDGVLGNLTRWSSRASRKDFGALIEAVNQVGSLFYGRMLGVFVLAFFVKRAGGTAAFRGVMAGQAAIFAVAWFTPIAYLWYNVIGCVVVLGVAWGISRAQRSASPGGSLPGRA